MSVLPTFAAVANDLRETVDAALPTLQAMSEREAQLPRSPGSGRPQVMGHLIDSAANNHHRFVRAQEGPALKFPPYAQEHWVGCQHYDDRSWGDLAGLWHAYNRHLAHVIAHIPETLRDVPCTIESDLPVTLGFLAADYVDHLRHHLAQVDALPG